MNIIKYTSFFHDGGIIDIKTMDDHIEICMESSELRPEWNEDNIPLSKDNRIKGILNLYGIKNVTINNKHVLHLNMNYDDGEILDFDIRGNVIEFLIDWTNFPPKERKTVFEKIIIESEKITWENVPDLFDPMSVE